MAGQFFSPSPARAVVVAVKNRNGRALVVAGLFGFVLALGDGSFVLPALARWVPGFAGVRFPSRYALGSVLVVTLLATWWLDRTFRGKRLGAAAAGVIFGLQAAILIAALFAQAEIYLAPRTPDNETRLADDLRAEGLPRDGAPPRVALPASILRANAGARCGVSTISGFNNPALTRTWSALYILAAAPEPDFHRVEVKDRIILKMNDWPAFFGLSATFKSPGNELHFAAPPVPRAFLSFSTHRVTNGTDALERVRSGHDFVREPLVEQDVGDLGKPAGQTGSATITHFGRNRIRIKYEASAPGLLVLAEAWYPGWTARLNDAGELAVIPVNGWMRGVQVPAGVHNLTFAYRPTWWWTGLGISFVAAERHWPCGEDPPLPRTRTSHRQAAVHQPVNSRRGRRGIARRLPMPE